MVRRQCTPARSAPGIAQAPRAAAGGEHQRVVRQHQAIVQAHVPLARGDVADATAEERLHPMLGEVLRGTDEQTLALEGAAQVLLR